MSETDERGSRVEKGTACYVGDAAASRRAKEWNGGKWEGGEEGVGRGALGFCLPKGKFALPSSKQRKTWGKGVCSSFPRWGSARLGPGWKGPARPAGHRRLQVGAWGRRQRREAEPFHGPVWGATLSMEGGGSGRRALGAAERGETSSRWGHCGGERSSRRAHGPAPAGGCNWASCVLLLFSLLGNPESLIKVCIAVWI